jgi:hypothetical protein
VYARVGNYTSPDCAAGTRSGWEDLPRTDEWDVEGSWQTVNVGGLKVYPLDLSIQIMLAVRDTDEADVEPPVSALFDEILLRAEP